VSTPLREPPQHLISPHQGPRREVQALRAIAVSAVVLYHLWPPMFPGGYAGVDIFFVISGFLITAHLVREADRTGRINLPKFCARRARRLLPASLVVIVASAVAFIALAPQFLWDQYLREIGAATLYILNWVLAADSVDYLAADNLASPVQHYWSLSVEEQFYLVWPLLVVVAYWVARKHTKLSAGRVLAVLLGTVTVASLVYSIFLTETDPAPAYFITPTRAWEFGIGGLLALLPPRFAPREAEEHNVVAAAISWLGLAAVVSSVAFFTSQTQFPGYAALLPVVGTAAIIWAGTPRGFSPSNAFALRPVQWLGDISYSLYLWHWPIVVLVPFAIGRELSPRGMLAVLALSIALGWLTKVLVEDPTRKLRWLVRRRARLTLGLTAAAMVLVVGATSFGQAELNSRFIASANEAANVAQEAPYCFGAKAFASDSPDPCINPEFAGRILPDVASGESDAVLPAGSQCRSPSAMRTFFTCDFGVPAREASLSIALVGDSHAEQWVPAIDAIAKRRGWHVVTFLKGGCPFSAVLRIEDITKTDGSCAWWNDSVYTKIKNARFDVIITTASTGHEYQKEKGESDFEAATRGLVSRWTSVEKSTGARVVAIRDNPVMDFRPATCLGALGAEASARASECSTQMSKGLKPDPQVVAGIETGVPVIDLTEFFCRQGQCPSVIGSVLVYRDANHMGGTYNLSLSPYLEDALNAALAE
jgi:peptidoglycan/LPS O-acetylase OafA/YrhL